MMTAVPSSARPAPGNDRAGRDVPGQLGADRSDKGFRGGTERAVDPAATLARVRPLMSRVGITRVANLTGLDRIGVPVVAVHRPNSRSLAVSQGKGATLLEAQISGIMESIEGFHAENVRAPLLLGSHLEMKLRHRVVDVRGLPRLSVSRFHPDLPLLWMVGSDLLTGAKTLVPYEMVHTDLRIPLPMGSGCFVMGSNGLASGNTLIEALSHGICEVVERDANTLWHLSGGADGGARKLDLGSVDDPACLSVLACFAAAGVGVAVWETTTDVGVASYLCTIVDVDGRGDAMWPVPPVSGSGCHPRRRIALLRALTEAAQGRLTIISGARDDISRSAFDPSDVRHRADRIRGLNAGAPAGRSFGDAPDADNDNFEDDLRWELERLASAGLDEVVAVNLTHPELAVPVAKIIIPGLETMCEPPGYVPGRRARRVTAGRIA
jgi:YcaO-like protein with predicted kinase domain